LKPSARPRPSAPTPAARPIAALGNADAQPSQSPLNSPPAAPVPEQVTQPGDKDPNTALALSLGGTVGSIALLSLGSNSDSGAMTTAGSLGLWLAPSFGHWYAGEGWTKGLSLRVGGSAAAVVGVMWVFTSCVTAVDSDGGGSDDSCGSGGWALAVGGTAAFVGGMVYDIATAPGAARRHNARARERLQGVSVQPTFGSHRAGVAVSGRF